MKKPQSAAVRKVEPSLEAQRYSMRVSRQPAVVRWPHRRRAMAVAIVDEVAGDSAADIWPGVMQFWSQHAVKSGIVMFWACYGIANWQAIGRVLNLV